jgi:nucleotide-binding universal stress UspA family protein
MNQKMKVLIAHDGSRFAEAALDDLSRAGLADDVEALVVCVAELWLPPPSSFDVVAGAEPTTPAERNHEALALARRVVDRVQKDCPGWQVRAESHTGSPGTEIIKQAQDWNAELIFIGSHGLTGMERWLLGSVSQKVIHDAPCSVRVARASDKKPGTPLRIVVGYDGAEDSQAAVREVAGRRWPVGSEVRLVTAAGTLFGRARARAMQEGVEARLNKTGLSVSSVIEDQDPKQVIVHEAETWKADTIFVGTSGHGRLGRIILGSVASAVAARAHCSVEVVRPRAMAETSLAN